jgi:pyruvate,orthophosphate dikinase
VKPSKTKLVYHFSEGDKDQKDLLGGTSPQIFRQQEVGHDGDFC